MTILSLKTNAVFAQCDSIANAALFDSSAKIKSVHKHCYFDEITQRDTCIIEYFAGDTVVLCKKDTIRFDNLSDFNYVWSNYSTKNYFVVETAMPISVRITSPDLYCWRIDTINVLFSPKPVLINPLNTDTSLCLGDSLVLNISGQENATAYIWKVPTDPNFHSTDTILTIYSDSTKFAANYLYIAQIQGICNYRAVSVLEYTVSDTAIVFFNLPPVVDLGRDSIYCPTDEFDLPALNTAFFDAEHYDILWNDGDTDNSIHIDSSNAGLHYVEVSNAYCGYYASDSVNIAFWNSAWTASHLVADSSTCEKIPILLDASVPFPLTTYLWLDDSSTNPQREVSEARVYSCELTDSAGCVRIFEANISEESCDPKVEMPDVFTPNGDGTNDIFKPKTSEKITNFDIKIFSSWGLKVYDFHKEGLIESRADVDFGWDGKHRGADVPTGVYFWTISYFDVYGKHYRDAGSVTLLR
jgi:gliding motility-associated-like protein